MRKLSSPVVSVSPSGNLSTDNVPEMALDFIAGCFGGCAGILVGHPLDTIKVRIQTQDHLKPQYKGTFSCLKSIIKHESFSGLYKGMSSPLAGVAVVNAIVFGVYGNLYKNLPDPDSISSHFVAGATAGIVQSFICSPMELAKTRIQIQKKKTLKGPLQCLHHVWNKEGVRGVFRGLNVTLLREGLGFGVYFSSYEWLTRREDSSPIGTAHLLAAGGASGAASWLCTYPLDVVKSRIQADGMAGKRVYKSCMDCLRKSTESEGVRCLFKGLSPTLLRAFPTNAATWVVVTWIMGMAKTEQEGRDAVEHNFIHDFAPSVSWHSCDGCFNYNFYLKYLADNSP